MENMNNTEVNNSDPRSKLLFDPTKIVLTGNMNNDTTTPVTRGVDDILKELPDTNDTQCGIWCLRGPTFQKFASKKSYIILYSFLGCMITTSSSYYNGIMTTIEKRFKITSQAIGIITIGTFVAQLLASGILSYYGSKGHRPRWMAVSIYIMVLHCCVIMLPHFLYGSGDDALQFTEYGRNISSSLYHNKSMMENKDEKFLCHTKENSSNICEESPGQLVPQVLLFSARFLSGIGDSLLFTLGLSYMDDNVQSSKTPTMMSINFFMKMIGRLIGFGLVWFSLKFYINPTLTPTITTNDPRWLGAWWMGWIIIAIFLFICGTIMSLFPKILPRAAARQILVLEQKKSSANFRLLGVDETNETEKMEQDNNAVDESEVSASFADMIETFKSLMTNSIYMCTNVAAVFCFLGYMFYWLYTPKYIETQYNQSASVASLATGIVSFFTSALGFFLSAAVLSKYKPKGRYLIGWNIFVNIIVIMGIISYAFIDCPASDNQVKNMQTDGVWKTQFTCNENCNCDYVTYNPVCSDDGKTFISACHAGCRNIIVNPDGTKKYTDCNCVGLQNMTSSYINEDSVTANKSTGSSSTIFPKSGTAYPGTCPIDCTYKFYIFLAVFSIGQLMGASTTGSSMLISMRCVRKKDKAVSMGVKIMILSIFSLIPAPIFYGYIFDKNCLLWGKTCKGTSNCWLYDGEKLRYLLNFTAAGFIIIGTIIDIGVWYLAKDLTIFDDDSEKENQTVKPDESATNKKQ